MPEKHRGAVDFHFPQGAFGPMSVNEPLEFYRVFERELPAACKTKVTVPSNVKLLLFCSSGDGTATVGSQSFSLTAGSLLFCPDGVSELLLTSADNKLQCSCVLFGVSARSTLLDLSSLLNFFQSINTAICVKDAVEYHYAFSAFLSEISLLSPTMLLVKGYFYQTIIAAYRHLSKLDCTGATRADEEKAVGQTVYAIIRYIETHLFMLHNLTDMAEELGYSYNYLSHLFRRKTGMTIQAYVTQKKIEQSTVLLADEQYSVTEIAAMLNYDCIQSFSKAFHRAMNMSPTAYRAKCLAQPTE